MDYSLLLGIEKKKAASYVQSGRPGSTVKIEHRRGTNNKMDASCLHRHRFISPDGFETYHLSIIDYLQLWNFNKKAEQFAKTKFLSKKLEELSAVEPIFYQDRFFSVLSNRIITVCPSEKKLKKLIGEEINEHNFESVMESRFLQKSDPINESTKLKDQ